MRPLVMFVKCTKCGEEHYSDEIEVENVEEDIMGRDVLTFVCPETNNTTESLVYSK